MQYDGNLVLLAPGSEPRWWTGTDGNSGAYARLGFDGNFVVYSSSNAPLWQADTDGTGAVRLTMQNDGNLVLYTAANAPVWASNTKYYPAKLHQPGELFRGDSLQSPNGAYRLTLQPGDGNLVLTGPTGPMWESDTGGTGYRMKVQSDGNMVIYNSSNVARWSTNTSGADAELRVQNDGNLVLVAGSGTLLWHSRTYPGGPGIVSPTTPGMQAVDFARGQLGDPYVWAAAGPDAWDCSGLTMMAWQAAGVTLPHNAAMQYSATTGAHISYANAKPGDLIFYSEGGPVTHVTIYAGDGYMIEAPTAGGVVVYTAVRPSGRMPYVGRPA